MCKLSTFIGTLDNQSKLLKRETRPSYPETPNIRFGIGRPNEREGPKRRPEGGWMGADQKILAIESPAYDPKFTGEYQHRRAQDGYRH